MFHKNGSSCTKEHFPLSQGWGTHIRCPLSVVKLPKQGKCLSCSHWLERAKENTCSDEPLTESEKLKLHWSQSSIYRFHFQRLQVEKQFFNTSIALWGISTAFCKDFSLMDMPFTSTSGGKIMGAAPKAMTSHVDLVKFRNIICVVQFKQGTV